MSKPANPPAFPRTSTSFAMSQDGMDLRDWFAGQAIAAIISATSAGQHSPTGLNRDKTITEGMAFDAYAIADDLLAERERGQ